jgi:adhesin/invasin
MQFVRNMTKGLAGLALFLSMVSTVFGIELKENSADIKQNINIPGMAVIIKRPGGETGCNTANHEKWDTAKGGCSNTEYMRDNAEVISIAADNYRLSIGVVETTRLAANVRTKDGQPVGAGVPVTWSTTNGYLSASSSVTDAASQAIVSLTTPKGTPRGVTTVTANARGGGANVTIVVANSAEISNLSANPPSTIADGSSFITLVATMTYENGSSVGPGESLSWGTQIGRYVSAETTTNANGQAVAYLVSSVPGTAFASATKEAAKLAQVTFNAPAPPAPTGPEIDSFAVQSRASENGMGTKYWTQNLVQFDGMSGYWQDNLFSWSARGAERFELVDAYGDVHYSGTGSEWHVNRVPIGGNQFGTALYRNMRKEESFTLKAYSGNEVTSKTIQVKVYRYDCGGGCSM